MAAQDEPLRLPFAEPEDEGPTRHSGPLSPEILDQVLPAPPPAPKKRLLARFITLKGIARVFSLLGVIFFGPGVFIFSIGAWWACFDNCPLDLAGRLAHEFRHSVVPGLALTLLAWLFCLLVIARSGNWTKFAVMLGVVVVGFGIIALYTMMYIGINDGNFFPITEDQLAAWHSVLIPWILFAALFSYLPLHEMKK